MRREKVYFWLGEKCMTVSFMVPLFFQIRFNPVSKDDKQMGITGK